MTSLIRRLASTIFVICLPILAFSQSSSADANAKAINQIFEEIPIKERLGETPENLHAQFSQNPFGLPAEQNQKMMDLFLETFNTDAMVADAKEVFQENVQSEEVKAAINWIQNEDTQKTLDAENEFYTIQGIRKRVVNKYELEQNPPSKERNQLISSLVENKSAIEDELESQVIIFRALVNAFSELSPQQSFSEAQIEGFVGNFRNQNRPQVEQSVTNQFQLMYHGLENDTLNNYISFYETDAGNWLSSTTTESIHTAYEEAAARFLEAVRNM